MIQHANITAMAVFALMLVTALTFATIGIVTGREQGFAVGSYQPKRNTPPKGHAVYSLSESGAKPEGQWQPSAPTTTWGKPTSPSTMSPASPAPATPSAGQDNPSPTAAGTPLTTIADALAQHKVQATYAANGLLSVTVTLTPAAAPLRIAIPRGTVLTPATVNTQSLIVCAETAITLDAVGMPKTLKVPTAGLDISRATPNANDRFTLGTAPLDPRLEKLLGDPFFAKLSARLQQYAVWIILNNPRADAFANKLPFGQGTNPTAGELKSLRSVYWNIGEDTGKYQAFSALP